jgi:hypothetical protein
MSGHEHLAAVPPPEQPSEQPSLISRRSALRGGAAAGIAGAALMAAGTPALAAGRHARGAARDDAGSGAAEPDSPVAEPVIAHVRNARTGEIDVFRGTSQTRLHDPALAALLVRASR